MRNFELHHDMLNEQIVIGVDTNEKSPVAFVFSCEQLSDKFRYAIVFAAGLLVFVYVLIMFELTHRTLAAFMGSLGGLALLAVVDVEKPSLLTIVTWVEWVIELERIHSFSLFFVVVGGGYFQSCFH